METTHNPHSSVQTISKTGFGNCKLTDMLPALRIIAKDYSINLNRPHNMRVAIRIAHNSVKNN
jgi:hypothetical protein